MTYKQYEKAVFDHLMSKHNTDDNFTFSVRQSSSIGSETDYFIGTEKSKYFSTTFWTLPISFPGSSADCIGLIFQFKKSLSYYFDLSQTQDPNSPQNKSVLNLVKSLLKPIQENFTLKRPVQFDTKLLTIQIAAIKKSYDDLDEMLNDIDSQLKVFIPLVDEAILEEKESNPSFKAHRIKRDEFESLIQKLNNRFSKFKSIEEDKPAKQKVTVDNVSQAMHPLNQILFGPPGTGKTYNTINKALSIIESTSERELGGESRGELKKRYQSYVDKGQIVFTTFHQSMSYEDFIEGIKPNVEEDEEGNRQVVYEVQDGVFKNLIRNAEKKLSTEVEKEIYSFDDGWNDLLSIAEEKLDNNQYLSLPLLTENKQIDVINITSNGNLKLKPKKGIEKGYTISYNRAKRLQQSFPDLSTVKNIDKQFRSVIGGSNSTAYWSVLNYINKNILQRSKVLSTEFLPPKPHVLIIDEINRGNVSAIFGELITLIEESKRAGSDEALEVILPYSKQKFSVPGNLYIIGTMNTADRSVEALDTALRRRFSFQQMLPQPELIRVNGALRETDGKLIIEGSAEIDLASVLSLINKRISVLLDADHQIGHSYFMHVKTAEELASTFRNCIIPLLQEYFYHDEEKIGWVLGEGFVGVKSDSTEDVFPEGNFGRRPSATKQQYKFNDVGTGEIVQAVAQLLGKYA
jgi:5-methylcytosine-specific restriction protein B